MTEFLKAIQVKKHYIMALAIMFVVVSLSGTTYSLFLKVDNTEDFTYSTGSLNLQFIEDEQISISNALPVIDSEGLETKPYSLTIKNTGSLPYQFDLKMLSSTEDNLIDMKYIKYQINEKNPKTLYETNNIIAESVLLFPEEEVTFKVKVWLDINTPNNQLGKTFMAKLVTSGTSVYRTLDTSGANRPELKDGMIPVYYDESTNSWKKADSSNMYIANEWYNYDNNKWANVVTLKDSKRQIYDITGNHNIEIDSTRTNNGNYVTDEKYLDLELSKYRSNNISSIFRVKFNDLNEDNIYIMSNDKFSYYYDTKNSAFVFKIGESIVTSTPYNIEKNSWHILGYTYNGSQVSFYIDGIRLSTNNITGSLYSDNSFKIGTDSLNKKLSYMEIGDVYIYNTVLTETEISTNYKNNINIIYHNLLNGYNDFSPKTTKEYYLSESEGTTIKNEDIASHYVWIPRFAYKLWNVTGSAGIDSYNAYNKGIEIIFENGTETSGMISCQNNICYNDPLKITKVTNNDNGKYYTHPAFTDQEKALTGIWISKYEISTNADNCNNNDVSGCLSDNLKIESKSGNTAWRNNHLSNYYKNIKTIANHHIIKNTEWGAISYLTHSKYGLCKDNKCSEIGSNKTYISGADIKDSTTNNMYGVFDLGGSASEFVMAGYADISNKLLLDNTRFANINISSSEYDTYQEDSFILGDATKEITLEEGIWYENYNSSLNETNNWLIRGGIGTTQYNGMFYYNATTDTPSEYITTRIVVK